ncbi:hypothetical protein ABPG75_006744 [Micractinium tetrahymenae]
MAAGGALPFLAGAVGALLLLRLVLAAINFVARRRRSHVRTLVVMGSGGHTAEMLALLGGFDLATYRPRCYVVAATDAMSGQKAAAFEAAAAAAATRPALADEEAPASAKKGGRASPVKAGSPGGQNTVRRSPRVAARSAADRNAAAAAPPVGGACSALPGARSPESPAKRRLLAGQQPGSGSAAAGGSQQAPQYSVAVIPRSREVGQSWASSVPSTLRALWAAVSVVLDHSPDLVLLNGPGTCIPIAAAAFLLRLLGLCEGRVVYVESIARVYRLSLSGKILYHSRLAHTFFVQWEELQQRYPRAVYAGRLM